MQRQIEPLARQLHKARGLRFIRQLFVKIDECRDVARGCLREPPRYRLPVAFHESEGDDALEHHDRRNDDEERARVKTLR